MDRRTVIALAATGLAVPRVVQASSLEVCGRFLAAGIEKRDRVIRANRIAAGG